MPTYEEMYYYLDHAVRKALGEMERQNFGSARETLAAAQANGEKMRCAAAGEGGVYTYFRNPYDTLED